MKHILVVMALFIWSAGVLFAKETVRIHGCVTDFNDQPLDSVLVSLKNRNFDNVYSVTTDANGYYSMEVSKGQYLCLYAVKPSDYFKTKLEYWTWNVPAFRDLEINPQYERMEVYSVNAFEPQVRPYETYMVYFRPMSLAKVLKLSDLKNRSEFEKKSVANKDTIDMAPSRLSKQELEISVNHVPAEVLNVTKTVEYGKGAYYYGYLVQIKKPHVEKKPVSDYDQITVVIHSEETNEHGKGDCFVKRVQ
ncbi:carboxypeptidase regulatory-like domain-containing protein [Marinilabiliaceae bacterium JC017]|nr:carboxypeptidase regulatory-like domain-containing protein [Marinilabiliaceae bacterium JC017]